MNALPLQFLALILAGWVNRAQQDVIDYLQEENRALREQLGGKSLRFTDVQRCRLAERAKRLSRRQLLEIGTLVTPDMLLRSHRELIAKKYDGSKKRGPGRPRRSADIEQLILVMARDRGGATPESKGPSTISDSRSLETPSSESFSRTGWTRHR